MEEGFGMRPNAIKSQSEYRGFFKAIVEYHNHENGKAIKCQVVNVSEWRRAIKEEFGLSWPATSERKKALSVQTVFNAYGITVTDDEADAVLLGRAAMRMGVINV
jgi:outer membrane phospholipase A